ncbi:MAG: hypothetical protein JNK74_13850 [Candidatus Hydrogenedentes bacterium]|nr:hypothetical protein [Candidatus Hydrogenedentota bacterium]
MSPLHVQLNRVRKRIWAQTGVACLSTALLWTASLACVWLLVCRLFPVLPYTLEGAGVIVFIGVAAALVLAWRQRPDIRTAALAADERLGLRERLTSSLELADQHHPMVEAVHKDALKHLGLLEAGRDFPLFPTRRTKLAIVPILLFGVGYVLLPEFDLFGYQERALEAKVQAADRQEKAERLEKVAKALKAPEKMPVGALDAKALELESLSEKLQEGKISEKQALAKVQDLRESLQQEKQALESKSQLNKSLGKASDSPLTKGLAKDLQQGNVGEAKKKLEGLQKKLAADKLSLEDKKKLSTELKEMAKELSKPGSTQTDAALAEALSKAAAALDSSSPDGMKEAAEALALSAKDLESVMQQLAQLDAAMASMSAFEKSMMGKSSFCRSCGAKLGKCTLGSKCQGNCAGKDCSGQCGSGQCSGSGSGGGKAATFQKGLALGGGGKGGGMKGPGQGQGGQVGELPDVNVSLTPTMLPGQVQEGKMLASIMQKTAPETDADNSVEVISGAVVQAQQAAEEALTREEIPRGSEEFVRQYFGTLEGEKPAD